MIYARCHKATVMKSLLIAAALVGFLPATLRAQETVGPNAPFGPLNEGDLARLEAFAKDRGYHLKEALPKIYPPWPPARRIDEKALGQLFQFSVLLTKWDQNARAYSHLVFSSFVYLCDEKGNLDIYSKVLDQQSTRVRQRIRDIFIYPSAKHGDKTRRDAEVEYKKLYPKLFPADYRYGTNDSLLPGSN
ncbi:MAG: hypothetical protein ACR2NX_11670 [Chthoniobacterales bacterium]